MTTSTEDERIATAIYTVNRHAKTAIDKKPLYQLKKLAIEKMLEEGRAQKMGLHFVRNPRNSQQQSSVLIQCADYYFHMIPTKADFKQLPHLGHLDDTYRNPIRKMNLKMAKQVLSDYIGPQYTLKNPSDQSTLYTQSYARQTNRRKQTMKSYLDS
ncbi:YkyB family protein [Psychrobacillus sp. OK032]|uniref:YkyB family protein n=1 Tax=Psychrobacillus sp. OK032 TaxID=1884358 RepID=UPI0008C0FC4F|nr:YkyB family protein [Psychrobacillus sp. OK032]SER61666.1 YkyB-like protein [Psychrobacillus sp. OK032]